MIDAETIIENWPSFYCLLCLRVCLLGPVLLPSGFAETTQSFFALVMGRSFQCVNALLRSLPIYHPVCLLSERSDTAASQGQSGLLFLKHAQGTQTSHPACGCLRAAPWLGGVLAVPAASGLRS